MREVWKYPLPWPAGLDTFSIRMPSGARVLAVQAQYDVPCLWALVDPGAGVAEARSFRIAGTGHPIEQAIGADGYVGTFQLRGGDLVFHVFEVDP